MPEQITPLSILYLLLHGAGTAVSVVLCLYLLLCRGKAIAPDITPPARLRRWTAALFGIMAMAHVWWILFYTFLDDTRSLIYGLLVAIDCMTLPPVFIGTLLTMLQDRRRPLWPIFVVMTPCIDLTTPNKVYGLVLIVAFIIYMVVAVRHYGRWLRDNYADLEHKEVWLSLTLLIGLMLLLMCYEYTDNYVMCTIAHLIGFLGFPLAGLLLWRVETLKDLSTDSLPSNSALSDDCPSKHSATPHEAKSPSSKGEASHIGQLLAKHCEDTKLYLQTDLTLPQLSAAVGVNRYYLSQYFASQDTSYYEYIHDLRIRHFIARYRELAAAQEPIVAQQLAQESGYHSYSTFSSAFKQRMHKSVTAWIREEV